MEVTCWNCKTVITLDRAAVEAAVKTMTDTKLDFFDVACPKCGKANRTKREEFEKALAAKAAPVVTVTAREATQQTKEENAKRRGDDKEKGAGKKALEKVKKGRK
jgi:hypothetical protein